jgi:hypothetical protein
MVEKGLAGVCAVCLEERLRTVMPTVLQMFDDIKIIKISKPMTFMQK